MTPHCGLHIELGCVVVARPLPEVQDTQTLSIMGALGRMCLRVVGVAGCCNRCSRNDLTSNFACCVIRQLGTALELPSWAGSGGTGAFCASQLTLQRFLRTHKNTPDSAALLCVTAHSAALLCVTAHSAALFADAQKHTSLCSAFVRHSRTGIRQRRLRQRRQR